MEEETAPDPLAWVGHTLEGKYAIEKVVGEGGFGVVYRGHHTGFDGAIAVKCLKVPDKLKGEERDKFLEAFLAEGRILHRLSQSATSIVRALDVGVATSPNAKCSPYLILEWLEGETLEDDLRRRRDESLGGRSLADTVALLDPIAEALGAVHAEGVAHRDIKPANIFLVRGAKRPAKLLDFGIAKVISETDFARAHEATGTSLSAFTPRYGAPEQFDRRFGATGPWTDVFALALIAVEVLTGASAMRGDTAQLFVQASNPERRPTPRAHGNDEGDEVEAVFAKALSVSPKERYPTAAVFWDALRHSMATGATLLSAPPTMPGAVTRPDRARPEPTPSIPAPTKRARELVDASDGSPKRARRGTLVLGSAAGVVALAVGWTALHPEPSGSTHPRSTASAQPPPNATTHAPTASASAPAPAPTFTAAPGFVVYEDRKFHFVAEVPVTFELAPDSTSENAHFIARGMDGEPSGRAELRLIGSAATNDPAALKPFYDELTKNSADVTRWVASQKLEPTRYVVESLLDRTVVYDKGIRGDRAVARLHFAYPSDEKPKWEPIVQHVEATLSFYVPPP